MTRRRLDDPTAHLDHFLAHATFFFSAGVVLVALTTAAMRPALVGALVLAALTGFRLFRHPLRLASISRVYLDGGRVYVARSFGFAREVQVRAVRHEGHSPWPCTLELADGAEARFVARRDDGRLSFFDLEISDRARYERPADARDSLHAIGTTMTAAAATSDE